MKRTAKIILFVLIAVALLLTVYIVFETNRLVTTEYVCSSEKVPAEFSGFRIVQLSDLHGKRFGAGQERLIRAVKEARPDVIVITGDLVSAGEDDFSAVAELLGCISETALTYYVTGNHESDGGLYGELRPTLLENGVLPLENAVVPLQRGDARVLLYGIMDPTFSGDKKYKSAARVARTYLSQFDFDEDEFNILLSHRPELLELYAEYPIDLALCGHAHAGQVRLPFVGAVYAPGQGIFPALTNGMHRSKDTVEVISGGLGTSVLPIRILAPPEIVAVELRSGA